MLQIAMCIQCYIYIGCRSLKEEGASSPRSSSSRSPPSVSPRSSPHRQSVHAKYYSTVPSFVVDSSVKALPMYRDHHLTIRDIPLSLRIRPSPTGVSSNQPVP